jgi:hypothetical protein
MTGSDVIDGAAAAVDAVGTAGEDDAPGRCTLSVGLVVWAAVVTVWIEVDGAGPVALPGRWGVSLGGMLTVPEGKLVRKPEGTIGDAKDGAALAGGEPLDRTAAGGVLDGGQGVEAVG